MPILIFFGTIELVGRPLNFLFHVSSHLNYAEHSENKADKFQIHYSKGKEDKAYRPNAHLSDILIEL